METILLRFGNKSNLKRVEKAGSDTCLSKASQYFRFFFL